jgi:small subunit ribosomal protein S12e
MADAAPAAAAPAPAAAPADQKDAAAAPAAAPAAPMDPKQALREVIKVSLHHNGLARGLHEAVKALDRKEAQLCILNSACDEKSYVKLVTALCKEHHIPLIKVEDPKDLGEWAGLCRYNNENQPVKIVPCSCVVIRTWGAASPAREIVLDHVKQNQ